MKAYCQRCERRIAIYARGLCWRCHQKSGERDRFAARSTRDTGPTEAELDALIAEQRKCLPPWWEDDARRCGRVG